MNSLVVMVAESLESFSKVANDFWSSASNHSEGAIRIEASGWECEAVLLFEEFLAEVNISLNVFELREVDLDHHIHGSTGFNWSETVDVL